MQRQHRSWPEVSRCAAHEACDGHAVQFTQALYFICADHARCLASLQALRDLRLLASGDEGQCSRDSDAEQRQDGAAPLAAFVLPPCAGVGDSLEMFLPRGVAAEPDFEVGT